MSNRNLSVLSLFALVSLSHAALAATAAPAPASKVQFTGAPSQVEFKAVGRPSALKIVGKGQGLAGDLAVQNGGVKGDIEFDLTTLTTGIEMRDTHMKEKYLETGKFPKAKLTITELKLPESAAKGDFSADELPFTGKLLLHGVEKPIQGKAAVKRAGKAVTAVAGFALKISDYAIAVPSFAGITIADEVTVKVDASGATL